MIKTTLQSRLIILMIMVSIFLISAFTTIQLNNQLQRATEFNIYRAKSGALIVKDQLQEVFAAQNTNSREFLAETENTFFSLDESDTIEEAALLDSDGTSLVSTYKNVKPSYDKVVLQKISQVKDKSRWLFPFVDKKNRVITLFVLFKNDFGYTAKLVFSLGNLQQALNEVYMPVALTVVIVVIANIILATMLSRTLIFPVKVLNEATKDIAGGNLEQKVTIRTQDELEELAGTFNYMTVELKKMKAKAENANPLTKLPGNIVIQEQVDKRLKQGEKFVLLYCDLDNFKAFNDKYGVHAGDRAIVVTADIFKEAVSRGGRENDFIGHEGGDDFLLLTVPERAEKIGNFITKLFDKSVREFYSKEDLERGYIEAKSRETDSTIKYPIMTISLAGVTNMTRKIDSYAQLTNIAAEVKKSAKKLKGSNVLIDRRSSDFGIEHRKG